MRMCVCVCVYLFIYFAQNLYIQSQIMAYTASLPTLKKFCVVWKYLMKRYIHAIRWTCMRSLDMTQGLRRKDLPEDITMYLSYSIFQRQRPSGNTAPPPREKMLHKTRSKADTGR